MDSPRVLDIHIHAIMKPGHRHLIRVRPFSSFRRKYAIVVHFSDGSEQSETTWFPRLNWWVTTVLIALPPWPPQGPCVEQQAAVLAEAGLPGFLAMLREHGGA